MQDSASQDCVTDSLWVGEAQASDTDYELIQGVADKGCLIEAEEMHDCHLALTK